jgi:hypothetical protein
MKKSTKVVLGVAGAGAVAAAVVLAMRAYVRSNIASASSVVYKGYKIDLLCTPILADDQKLPCSASWKAPVGGVVYLDEVIDQPTMDAALAAAKAKIDAY